MIYIAIAIYSFYFACRFVNKPGISSEARKLIVNVHIGFITVNILCQLYNFMSMVVMPKRVSSGKEIDFDAWYWRVMEHAFFGQGLLLSLVRMIEPLFARTVWYEIKIRVKACCCRSPD